MSADPWRFRCTECDSTSWQVRTGTEGLIGKHCEHRYYCTCCKTGADTLLDKKTGKEVRKPHAHV